MSLTKVTPGLSTFGKVYATYAEATTAAASTPADVLTIKAKVGEIEVSWGRKPGGPCLGGGWEPADPFYSPLHFGAIGDGVTDDGAAINAAASAYRDKVNAVVQQTASLDFDMCGRVYVTTVSLNFTGLSTWGWGIKNGTIIGRCVDKAVIDAVGSRGGEMDNVIVYGDPAFPPRVGIQTARAATGTQTQFCDNWTWTHVMTRGFFSLVGVWCYGQESATYLHCGFWNTNPLGAAAFHVGTDAFEYNGVSPVLMQSDYLDPMTGETSYINNLYSNCDWRYLPVGLIYNGTVLTRGATTVFTTTFAPANFAVGDTIVFYSEDYQTANYGAQGVITAIAGNDVTVDIDSSAWAVHAGQTFSLVKAQTGATVVFGRGRDHNFSTCYIVAYGDYALDLVFGASGIDTMDKINLDFLFEGAGPGYIRFRNNRPNLGLTSSAITLYQVRCRDHCISAPGVDVLRLHDVHISVPGARHRTPLVFDTPSKYQIVGGHIYVYQEDRLPRTGWSIFRTRVVDRSNNLDRTYGAAFANGLDIRQVPGGPTTISQRILDSAGAVRGFFRYDLTSNGWLLSNNGTDVSYALTDAALYPNDDILTDLGLPSRRWRQIHGGTFYAGGVDGKSGTFTTTDGKTITVSGGVITSIV